MVLFDVLKVRDYGDLGLLLASYKHEVADLAEHCGFVRLILPFISLVLRRLVNLSKREIYAQVLLFICNEFKNEK